MVAVHMGHSFGFGSEIRNFLERILPYATRERQTHGGTLANTHSTQLAPKAPEKIFDWPKAQRKTWPTIFRGDWWVDPGGGGGASPPPSGAECRAALGLAQTPWLLRLSIPTCSLGTLECLGVLSSPPCEQK